MSRVISGDECRCACHRDRGTRHCVPCCDGKCKLCRKYVTNMTAHVAAHQQRIQELLDGNKSTGVESSDSHD